MKSYSVPANAAVMVSPPSRGAWIEILPWAQSTRRRPGRPPRGGRGLKLTVDGLLAAAEKSPPSRGGVD